MVESSESHSSKIDKIIVAKCKCDYSYESFEAQLKEIFSFSGEVEEDAICKILSSRMLEGPHSHNAELLEKFVYIVARMTRDHDIVERAAYLMVCAKLTEFTVKALKKLPTKAFFGRVTDAFSIKEILKMGICLTLLQFYWIVHVGTTWRLMNI